MTPIPQPGTIPTQMVITTDRKGRSMQFAGRTILIIAISMLAASVSASAQDRLRADGDKVFRNGFNEIYGGVALEIAMLGDVLDYQLYDMDIELKEARSSKRFWAMDVRGLDCIVPRSL